MNWDNYENFEVGYIYLIDNEHSIILNKKPKVLETIEIKYKCKIEEIINLRANVFC